LPRACGPNSARVGLAVKVSGLVAPGGRVLDPADRAGRASEPAGRAGRVSDRADRAWEQRGEGEVAGVLAAVAKEGSALLDSALVSGRAMIPSRVR